MSVAPKGFAPRIVVLKRHRLYGELVSRHVRELWRGSTVDVFQRGFDALDSIQVNMPDLFITGALVEDMDGLEHLEPFIETTLPILVLTSRRDTSTLELLRGVRFDGLYDGDAEGMEHLPAALQQVIQRRLYISPTMVSLLKRPKNVTLDTLTEKEQMVLSVIGDGSDDQLAAERLALSPHTVNTHRKSIMAKLKLHHKGQLMIYALQHGFIWVTARDIFHPGFQRRLQSSKVQPPASDDAGRIPRPFSVDA